MRRPQNRIWRTSFGTSIAEINPTQGVFKVTKDVTIPIDTPLQDVKGTTKTFLSGAIVEGNLWQEIDQRAKKQRKVVLVKDETGRYLIPKDALEPTTREEIESGEKVKVLEDEVESLKELLSKAKDQANQLLTSDNNKDSFLDKKYGNFTGKELLLGALGVIIIVKLFK
jgi:hypothetical protein